MIHKLLAFLLLFSSLTFASTVITGTIKSPSGSLFNGTISFYLPFPGVKNAADPACPSACPMISQGPVKFYVVNGRITGPNPNQPNILATLVANGDISPPATVYQAIMTDIFGLYSQSYYVYIPSGGTFDIGTAFQTTITTTNVSVPLNYQTVETSGSAVTQRPTLNFIGTTCVDNPGLTRTDCTTSGAGFGLIAPAFLGNWEGSVYPLQPTTDGPFSATLANQVNGIIIKLLYPYTFNTITIGFHVGQPTAVVGVAYYTCTNAACTTNTKSVSFDNITGAFSNTIVTVAATGGPVTLQPGIYIAAWACSLITNVAAGQGLANGGSNEAAEPWNNRQGGFTTIVRGGHSASLMVGGILPNSLNPLVAGFTNSNSNIPAWIIEPQNP